MTPAEYIRASPLWPSECLDGMRDEFGKVWADDGSAQADGEWVAAGSYVRDGVAWELPWVSFRCPDLDHAGTRAMLLEHLSRVTGRTVTVRLVHWGWPVTDHWEAAVGTMGVGSLHPSCAHALLDAWKWAERRVAEVTP